MSGQAEDRWWDGFQSWLREQPDPHDAARRLRRHLSALPPDEQRRLLNQAIAVLLRERHAYGVTLFLLEGITDPDYLHRIATELQPLPGLRSDDEESHLSDLIRILAAAEIETFIPVVRDYLLNRPISPHWASVPWALWPHHAELFTTSWRRFFLEIESDRWKNTLVIKSFLTEPEAIQKVRAALEPESVELWNTLRSALLRQAGTVGWLSRPQTDELEQALQ